MRITDRKQNKEGFWQKNGENQFGLLFPGFLVYNEKKQNRKGLVE